MTKLDMSGIAVLCALGVFATAIVVAVAPDLKRYFRLRNM